MFKKVFAIIFGVAAAALPSHSFAQAPAHAGEESCSIHFWPAADMRAAVDSLVGGGLIDSLAGVGPLPEATATLRSSLDPKSQFEILQSLDFAPVIRDAKPAFVLETELSKPLSLKKKSPPLTKPETNCYIEVIMVATAISSHMIYGVTLNSALIVRIYHGSPVPDLAIMTAGGTKIDKGKSKIRHSSIEMAGDLKLAFQANLKQAMDYVASRKPVALR